LIVSTQATWRALSAAVLLSLGSQAQAAAPAAPAAGAVWPAASAASAAHAGPGHGPGAKPAKPAKPAKLIDLNNASKAQLLTLPGIGDAEAERIIAKRPFNSKAAIVTDAGIPAGVYLANRRNIFVGRIAKPKPKP
jgi:DNA uptake protein ComE-like DNA-binding protein